MVPESFLSFGLAIPRLYKEEYGIHAPTSEKTVLGSSLTGSYQITATQHAKVMNQLNAILASAYDPYRSILDNTVAIVTLYLSTLVYSSHYQKVRWPSVPLCLCR